MYNCPPGQHYQTTTSSCRACAVGFFCPGKDAAHLCDYGTYAANTSQASCTSCPCCSSYTLHLGSVSAQDCLQCPPGRWFAIANSSACSPCLIGQYRAGNMSQCAACPMNTFSPTYGSTTCYPCPPSSSSLAGQGLCLRASRCGAGFYEQYWYERLAFSCSTCPSNMSCPGDGLYYTCQAGRFYDVTKCSSCPSGRFCPGDDMWYSCPPGFYCVGTAAPLPCPAGSYQPLYRSSASLCRMCPSGRTSAPGQAVCTPTLNCGFGICEAVDGLTCEGSGGSCSGSGDGIRYRCAPAQFEGGMDRCLSCPQGYFLENRTTIGFMRDVCVACPPGTRNPLVGQLTCYTCLEGEYRRNETGACEICPVGSFCRGDDRFIPCPAGTFSAFLGSVSCDACPAGTYNSETGRNSSTFCVPCAAGTYSSVSMRTSSSNCVRCPAGTFSPLLGQNSSSSCIPCLAGTYISGIGASSCIACAAGTFNTVVGSTSSASCTLCPAGTFSTMSECTDCPPGTYSGMSGRSKLSDCISCPSGTYGTRARQTNVSGCVPCPIGTYNPTPMQASSDACRFCAPGSYNDVAGRSVCAQCPAGTYSTVVGGTTPAVCELCPPGFFSDEASSGSCSPCPAGTFGTSEGSASIVFCVACPAGTYGPESGSTRCSLCPPGSFGSLTRQTTIGACAFCSAGSFSAANGSSRCTLCPVRTYSPVIGASSCLACSSSVVEGAVSCTDPVASQCTAATTAAQLLVAVSLRALTANATSVEGQSAGSDLFVTVRYGVPLSLTASLAPFASPSTCPAVLTLANDTSPSSAVRLPPWMSVSSPSALSMVVSGTVSSIDAPPRSNVSFRVVAWDNTQNPFVRVHLTVDVSLSLIVPPQTDSSPLLKLQTPAALVTLRVVLDGGLRGLELVCPASFASAFCTFDPTSGVLGAFGTVDGIQAVLDGVSIAASAARPSSSLLSAPPLLITVEEQVNPQGVSVSLPVSRIRPYPGIAAVWASIPNRTHPLAVTVGVPFTMSMTSWVHAQADIRFQLLATPHSWLTLTESTLQGMAPAVPSGSSSFIVVVRASEKYTSIELNVSCNVSYPQPPAVQAAAALLSSYLVASSEQAAFVIPSSTFADPQGGSITPSLFLSEDSGAARKPLPSFIRFDAATWTVVAAPQSSDVGAYNLVLVGTASNNYWRGEATAPVSVTVVLSSWDVIALLYGYIGIGGTVVSIAALAFATRSTLRNLWRFRSVFAHEPPRGFFFSKDDDVSLRHSECLRYVSASGSAGPPLPWKQVASVRAYRLAKPFVLDSSWVPGYFRLMRLIETRELPTDPASSLFGVDWLSVSVRLVPSGARTIEGLFLRVDLEKFVESESRYWNGQLNKNDEPSMFVVIATTSGSLWRDCIEACFCFSTADARATAAAGEAAPHVPSAINATMQNEARVMTQFQDEVLVAQNVTYAGGTQNSTYHSITGVTSSGGAAMNESSTYDADKYADL